MPLITVATATYNYGCYIHRVYESLKEQTFKDFEWIIVDDGSEDNTEELVQSWIEEKPFFPIRYHKFPENRGKMAATNQGARMAEGYWFMDIGADDALKPYALEHFMKQWDAIDPALKDEIGVLMTHCEDQHGIFVGNHYPSDPLICDYYEKQFVYRIMRDQSQLFKTQVMLEFPYYDKVDKHVIHSATYFDIAEKYKVYCFEDICLVYYRGEKNSLSYKTKKLRFIKGRQFYAERRINKYIHHIPKNAVKKYKYLFILQTFVSYIRYSHHMGLRFHEMFKRIDRISDRLLFLFVAPTGFAVCISDKIKGRV